MSRGLIPALAALVLFQSASAEAQVRARIRRVGLFEGTQPWVRSGCTSFVDVEFANLGSDVFEGEARVNQQDRDGDVVTCVEEVGLTPDGHWQLKQIYFTAGAGTPENTLQVRLFDRNGVLVPVQNDAGEPVNELVSPIYVDLPAADDFLIVDLSAPRRLPHVACLDSGGMTSGQVEHARWVRSMKPSEVPLEWQGLEAVDAIVWDDADPAQLTERQTTALIDWVKNGGRLLLTGGRANWQSLATSSLAAELPVAIKGLMRVPELPAFSRGIVKNDEYARTLEAKYEKNGVARCRMVANPDALRIPADEKGLEPIAYRSFPGRGSLAFVGASLRELLPPPPGAMRAFVDDEAPKTDENSPLDEFRQVCERVIASNFLALPKTQTSENHYMMVQSNLFDLVSSTIGYKGLGFAFLMFALLFAIVYGLAACGSHFYLRKRQWQQHSWSAFAAVSLVGTIIGVVMVWSLRGVTTKVRQTTIVDAPAGSSDARATCFFGVKTPDHTRLELRLPGVASGDSSADFGVLRSLPRSANLDLTGSMFVATELYRAANAATMLEDVPVRATLKEFFGRCRAQTPGSLDAKLVIPPDENDRFGKGGFIQNNTGVTLENCYILEGPQEIAGEGGVVLTRCLSLGTIPKSGEGALLDGDALHRRLYYQPPDPSKPADPPKLIPGEQLFLRHHAKIWRERMNVLSTGAAPGVAGQVSSAAAADEYGSLLLLSVFNLIEQAADSGTPLNRSHGRMLDCSHAITRNTAVLIGHSSEGPPVQLEIDGVRRKPEKSITLYRFIIPVERPGEADEPKANS